MVRSLLPLYYLGLFLTLASVLTPWFFYESEIVMAGRPRPPVGGRKLNKPKAPTRPSKIVEGGVSPYAAVRLAQAGVKAAQRAVASQNKAATTYRSVDPRRSEAAKKAAQTRTANAARRVSEAKAKGRGQGAAVGAAGGAAVYGAGTVAVNRAKKASRNVNPASVRAKAEAKKKKK